MATDEIRKRGPVTDYRPDEDDVKGGSDHSVQSEARDADGSENLANDGATSGGAAGRVDEFESRTKTPR